MSSPAPASRCKYFSGYKPCSRNALCNEGCQFFEAPLVSILIIHLGALGAVVRSTSLLRAIKRKFPSSMITWVTDAPANGLLQGHPLIDRVLTTLEKDLLNLGALEFEVGYVIDKSLKAIGVLKRTQVDQVYGFICDSHTGAILPATNSAAELWQLGLDNQQKFYINQKPETQLLIEALELGPFQQDEYFLPLTSAEEKNCFERKSQWSKNSQKIILGINTGCSDVIAYKKLSIDFQRELIQRLTRPEIQVVLLGGPEDTQRNSQIAAGLEVINSATELGLRDGLVSISACDLILTGDSLGMHMAISQHKYTVAWFGPTCAQEIDLYGRGEKILTKSTCAPCWKRVCSQTQMCYDQVSVLELIQALEKGIRSVSQFNYSNSFFRGPAAQHSSAKESEKKLA